MKVKDSPKNPFQQKSQQSRSSEFPTPLRSAEEMACLDDSLKPQHQCVLRAMSAWCRDLEPQGHHTAIWGRAQNIEKSLKPLLWGHTTHTYRDLILDLAAHIPLRSHGALSLHLAREEELLGNGHPGCGEMRRGAEEAWGAANGAKRVRSGKAEPKLWERQRGPRKQHLP